MGLRHERAAGLAGEAMAPIRTPVPIADLERVALLAVRADHADQPLARHFDAEHVIIARLRAGADDHDPAFGGDGKIRLRRHGEHAANARIAAEARRATHR
ncbi:MAG: hypothetical protein R3C16_08320 [Hyphomonadaceae bacterium]